MAIFLLCKYGHFPGGGGSAYPYFEYFNTLQKKSFLMAWKKYYFWRNSTYNVFDTHTVRQTGLLYAKCFTVILIRLFFSVLRPTDTWSSSSSVAPAGLRGELGLWREGPPRTCWPAFPLPTNRAVLYLGVKVCALEHSCVVQEIGSGRPFGPVWHSGHVLDGAVISLQTPHYE